MTNENSMGPADFAAMTGGNRNSGFFGGDNAWFLIILFLFIFAGGWGGYGGYGGGGSQGAANNYVLASDFATIQRQISDATNTTERKLDSLANGLCDLGYTNANLIYGVNNTITQAQIAEMQNSNATQRQIADCCCQNREAIAGVNYNMSTQANAITNAINSGFCQTNYNNATNTRDIIDNQNANSRAILDAIQKNVLEAKNEKIADLQAQLSAANLAASQCAQNTYLINQLRPSPMPAYAVPNPYAYGNNCCGCGT